MVLLTSLFALATLASAGTITKRQAAGAQVAKLTSIENIAVRSNGQILATSMSSTTIYSVNATAKTSASAIVVSGAAGFSGIGEYLPDQFAVIGGGSTGTTIYKIDFSSGKAVSTLVKKIAEASNLNGLAVLNNDTVLVGDAGKGVVYRFTMSTGAYSVAISDPTMVPSGGIPFGIDGLKYKDGVVWYTNIFKNSFHKVPVDATGKATGAVVTLWTNLMGDDLCFGPSGKIYVATNGKNSLVEVDPAAASPTPKAVATVSGSTSCAFGRTESDKDVVYIGGSGGVFSATIK
ncbi:hypothetical protein G7Y89_g77 [Cudoniella acicularis]|uniref:SMP-30/Gluconolactonase/LRE-like region domain-containing protein n=1 Tax=Cudoniella acicularis TaxID=354080 RepID=A0A8H4WAR4_9HELO|nr:hypothetical protein G7Y89_g77 [Cudoniella acicularis]